MESLPFRPHDYRRIACRGCGHTFDVPISCGNRFCELCSGPRRRKIVSKLKHMIANTIVPRGYRWRFVTLTIPRQSDLRPAASVLTRSFRRLRQRRFWRSRVAGGAYVIEVVGQPGNWHVHLHVIVLSSWIPVHRLSVEWRKCSPGKIVHVKYVPPSAMITYVTKYATKTDLNPKFQLSASHDLRGQRLFQPFGVIDAVIKSAPKLLYRCSSCGYDHFIPLDRRTLDFVMLKATAVDDMREFDGWYSEEQRAAPLHPNLQKVLDAGRGSSVNYA